MSKCSEHWCENYGTNNAKCAECKRQDNIKDMSDMRAIFKRGQLEHMGAMGHIGNKKQGQER